MGISSTLTAKNYLQVVTTVCTTSRLLMKLITCLERQIHSALVCSHIAIIAGHTKLCIDAGFEQLNAEASSEENYDDDEMDYDEGY